MSVPSYSFHSFPLKFQNKRMSFPFIPLKHSNKIMKKYSKMILFISFHSLLPNEPLMYNLLNLSIMKTRDTYIYI